MAFGLNAAPTVSLFGIVDPRLAGQASRRPAPPPVIEAEVVEVSQQSRHRLTGERTAEVRLRQRVSPALWEPALIGPIAYGADGKPRYLLQSTPGAILSTFA